MKKTVDRGRKEREYGRGLSLFETPTLQRGLSRGEISETLSPLLRPLPDIIEDQFGGVQIGITSSGKNPPKLSCFIAQEEIWKDCSSSASTSL